ncbi:thiamine pyrophosphate-dependent dehydrogenase E1 component subunit alpha [Streptomyces sp. NBC_00353]|uniref:thiamine pyrophosphate-dependent dehydrogenase E1 component subunit alpha n=1 Tax=Streptomyces sp. NBC_00353 TaxID=2975722 RepID=UPI002E2672EB
MTSHQPAEIGDLAAMQRIRSFEEKTRELSLARQIIGSVHLSIGQEAIPVGACAVLQPQDAVFATYRGHGWALARGVPLAPSFAELLGRSTGLNGGRGGSPYFSAPQYGFFGENSIVGAGAPIAVGAALAARYDGSGRVAVVSFGDGATNQGAMHEAMNFAAAFSLPVVFVCENNTYSELTPIAEMVGEPELWRRAAGYGMPGSRIDGNSVTTVRDAMAAAVDRARAGEGPSFIEAMTERLVGHYIGDVEHYRPAGEVASAWQREPIGRLERELVAQGVTEAVCRAAVQQAADEVERAVAEALAAPLASAEDVKEHLYA